MVRERASGRRGWRHTLRGVRLPRGARYPNSPQCPDRRRPGSCERASWRLLVKRVASLVIAIALFDAGCAAVADLGTPRPQPSMDSGAPSDAESDVDADSDAGDSDAPEVSVSTVQAVAVAVGSTHACAVVKNGPSSPDNDTVRCWGSNASGELGIDPTKLMSSSRPVEVTPRIGIPANKASTLTLAAGYSCETTTDQYLLCWGSVPGGSSVARGQDSPAYEPSLMDINASPLQVTSASMGPEGGCSTLFDGSLACWGGDLVPGSPDGGIVSDAGVFFGDAFETVAVGTAHACGIGTAPSTA